MKQLPKTTHAAVVRTDFEKQEAWETICELLRAPVYDSGEAFYAYVELAEDRDYRDLSEEELMALVPDDYGHSFVFVVDGLRSSIRSSQFSSSICMRPAAAVSGRSLRKFRALRTIYRLRTWTSKISRRVLTRMESFEDFQNNELPASTYFAGIQ